MTRYVIDASVAVKWFLPQLDEPEAEEAGLFLERFRDGQFRLIAPELLWVEFANVMWRAVRRGRLSKELATEALAAFQRLKISRVMLRKLVDPAYELAMLYDCSVYDGLYASLAIRSDIELVTADEKLIAALPTSFPILRLGRIHQNPGLPRIPGTS